jgi:hypothetical protein
MRCIERALLYIEPAHAIEINKEPTEENTTAGPLPLSPCYAVTGPTSHRRSNRHGNKRQHRILAGGAGTLYLSQSSFWSVSADIGGSSAGAVSGTMNMGCQIRGAISSSLTPWIAMKFGWTAAFIVAAMLVLCGGGAWLLVYTNGRSRVGVIQSEVEAA